MPSLTAAPGITVQNRPDGSLDLRLSGDWVLGAELPDLRPVLNGLTGAPKAYLGEDKLGAWDSRLPIALIKLVDHCKKQDIEIDWSGLPEGAQGLLRLAYAVPERAGARRKEQRTPIVAQVGKAAIAQWQDAKALVSFVGETIIGTGALLTGRARFRPVDVVINVQEAGPSALPIVTLISLLVGLILAFVGAVQLSLFGAQIFIANLVGLGMVREMGPLMTAIIMAGRTGASYAAQLGTMNVNSEIDALKTMGISPTEFLVLPRMVALILMMPFLTLYSNFTGMVGGALVTTAFFDVSLVQYVNQTTGAVRLTDFFIGIGKSVVFAVLIATAGCMRGMLCGRSASAVGDAATAAVVDCIVYLVVADSVITLICNRFGI